MNRKFFIAFGLTWVPVCLPAQTTLPEISVTAPYETVRGGYVISSNFHVDDRLSAVVYPAEPFQKDDILSVRPEHLKSDEYLVLQECASVDCTQGHILRVWNRFGALGVTTHDLNRVWIPHEGKFFIWMQRFPISGYSTSGFTGFEEFSPPLVLNPTGTSEQFKATNVTAAQELGPIKVTSSTHDGSSFVIRYEGGTSVMIERMHAVSGQ
jgi:hypothetical protein